MSHNKDEIPRGQKSGHRYQEKIFWGGEGINAKPCRAAKVLK